MAQIKHRNGSREVKIQKWGNNKAVRLPKDILEEAGFEKTDDVVLEVEVEPHRISLVSKNKLTPFEKLFVEYEGGKPATEPLWDEAEPVGKEEW